MGRVGAQHAVAAAQTDVLRIGAVDDEGGEHGAGSGVPRLHARTRVHHGGGGSNGEGQVFGAAAGHGQGYGNGMHGDNATARPGGTQFGLRIHIGAGQNPVHHIFGGRDDPQGIAPEVALEEMVHLQGGVIVVAAGDGDDFGLQQARGLALRLPVGEAGKEFVHVLRQRRQVALGDEHDRGEDIAHGGFGRKAHAGECVCHNAFETLTGQAEGGDANHFDLRGSTADG